MMVSEHIGEQSNAQREWAKDIVRDLDHHHKPAQPPKRPKKAQQVFWPLMRKTLDEIIDEADPAECKSQVCVARRWRKARDKAHEICRQNEQEKAAKKGHVPASSMHLRNLRDQTIQPLHHNFGTMPQRESFVRHCRIGCSRERTARHVA